MYAHTAYLEPEIISSTKRLLEHLSMMLSISVVADVQAIKKRIH